MMRFRGGVIGAALPWLSFGVAGQSEEIGGFRGCGSPACWKESTGRGMDENGAVVVDVLLKT